jgi:hypothetical protein
MHTLEFDLAALLLTALGQGPGDLSQLSPRQEHCRRMACLQVLVSPPSCTLSVHKALFLARSPFFRAKFAPEFTDGAFSASSATAAHHNGLDFSDVPWPVACAVLRFVYCCAGIQAVSPSGDALHEFSPGHLAADVSPSHLTEDELVATAHFADLLLLPDLRALCTAAAVKCATVHNATPFYAVAEAFGMRRLASQCARVMAVHLDLFVLQGAFLDLIRASADSISRRQAQDSVPLVDDILGELGFVEVALSRGLEQSCAQAAAQEGGVHQLNEGGGRIASIACLPAHVLNSPVSCDWSGRKAAARRRELTLGVLALMRISVLGHGQGGGSAAACSS